MGNVIVGKFNSQPVTTKDNPAQAYIKITQRSHLLLNTLVEVETHLLHGCDRGKILDLIDKVLVSLAPDSREDVK